MSDDLPESDFEGVWYHWSCVQCSAVNETEQDVRDVEVECDACGAKSIVRGTM